MQTNERRKSYQKNRKSEISKELYALWILIGIGTTWLEAYFFFSIDMMDLDRYLLLSITMFFAVSMWSLIVIFFLLDMKMYIHYQ